MGRIIAIDLGSKRTGLATTDPLRIICSPLDTAHTPQLLSYLKEYFATEKVDEIVLGHPSKLNNEDTDMTAAVKGMKNRLEKEFPDKKVHLHDERFTSQMALNTMIAGGMKKKDRRKKGNVDRISATIILQSYLESIR